MALTSTEIARIVNELSSTIVPGIIQKIYNPSNVALIFEIRSPGKTHALLISLEKSKTRLHLVAEKYKKLEPPTNFCLWLRKQLIGKKISAIHQHESDRIVIFSIDPFFLIFECFPQKPLLKFSENYSYPAHIHVTKSEPRFSNSREIEKFYLIKEQEEKNKSEDTALQKQIKKVERLKLNLENDLKKMELLPDYYALGEIVKAHLYLVKKRMSEITIDGISITLDPKLSPQENLEKLFKKAKRKKHGIEEMKKRLATLRVAKPIPTPSLKTQVALPYHQYTSSTGKTILVGKSAKHNDTVTFKHANPHDIWMHVNNHPGAHVVVKLNRNETIDSASLLEAGMLALYFSGFRENGDKEEIIYAERKFLKKPKGLAAGAVTVTRGKTLLIRMDLERMKSIKSKRLPFDTF